MAEFVQRRKEQLIAEIPVLESHFKKTTVKRILTQREKFEYRLMRRNKQKSDFTSYIVYLKSIMKKVEKMGTENTDSIKLLGQHKNRIVSLYRTAVRCFKNDLSLWKEYIRFLVKYRQYRLLPQVLDSALLLHGQISDELYIFAVKQEFGNVKNMQKTRELYTTGLRLHKNSSALYIEAFKSELEYSQILTQKVLKTGLEFNRNDPALNGSIAKVIFESAVENVKNDFSLFFQMYKEATGYTFALDLSKEIKNFMLNSFSLDSSYWNTLALNELSNESKTEKSRIKACLDKYDEALSIIDTEEMWDKYLATILSLTADTEKTEVYKRNLLRQSMYNAHQKRKLKPTHYIQWINKTKSFSTIKDILVWALEMFPNDKDILEYKVNNLVETDKLKVFELLKQNINISPSCWLNIVEKFSNEPQLKDIFEMVFGDRSVCSNEVKQKLGKEYLQWLIKNKSLDAARAAYNKMIISNNCDVSLCKTIVSIETNQEKIDITKIRQHFMLACMQFGKTSIDLWMDRIHFELKYGSPKIVSSTYHQALTTLNNEESDKFVEEYALRAPKFNV